MGIIPTIVEEEWGNAFSLSSPDHSKKNVMVNGTFKGKTILGCYALLANLSPNRTMWNPNESRNYDVALAATIVSHEAEIFQLVKKKN